MIATSFGLLYLCLVFSLVSVVCASYTLLRTLLPCLPSHPLHRRQVAPSVETLETTISPPVEQRPRLKSAQRFTVYLALADVLAACILVWEVVSAVSANAELGASKIAASRLFLATTARPTLLLVVAVLSYANVVQGRQIALGRADWIVWLPALLIYAAGAGLASIARVDGPNAWIGLASWLSTVTCIVAACFGRLLVAILRVRRLQIREQAFSRFASEQEKVVSQADLPYPSLPAWRNKFSDLSPSFLARIGHSSSSVNLVSHQVLPFTSDTRSAVSYAHSRASTEVPDELDYYYQFRSPTPGSSKGLLDRSATSTPAYPASRPVTPGVDFEIDEAPEVLGESSEQGTVKEDARNSFSSFASRASTYLQPGGFLANGAVRTAINNSRVKEAWQGQEPPGTGHSKSVELSQQEMRGALVRIGGHAVSSLLAYALVSPFVFLRAVHPSSAAPLIVSILLSLGICHSSLILAWQVMQSEGFWFRRPASPVLTSSSVLAFEQVQGVQVVDEGDDGMRSCTRASTARSIPFSLPGISLQGGDCSTTEKGRIGRALSMMNPHPKLQLLPPSRPVEPTSTSSGFVKSATTSGHARLRSLKLGKTSTVNSFDEFGGRTRPRSGSAASRKTVGGFEHHARHVSAPIDTMIAMSLLNSRKTTRPPSRDKVPFGFSHRNGTSSTLNINRPSRAPTPSPLPSPIPSLSPAPSPSLHPITPPAATNDFGFTDFIPSSPTATVDLAPAVHSPSDLPDITIDFLSSQLLPQLVPTIKVGKETKVESKDLSLPRRRSTVVEYPSNSLSSRKSTQSGLRRSRNIRNLSLPLFSLASSSAELPPLPQQTTSHAFATEEMQTEKAVEEDKKEPERILAGLAKAVRESCVEGDAPTRSSQDWSIVSGPPESPPQPAISVTEKQFRGGSNGTLLDISFEWEEQDHRTEVLEDQGALADGEDEGDDNDESAGDAVLSAHLRRRQATSPSPPSPSAALTLSRLAAVSKHQKVKEGAVVLRGSRTFASDEDEEDEDDPRTATLHCASVHPVLRGEAGEESDGSSAGATSPHSLRPTHLAINSLNSLASFRSPSPALSITAPGFHNLMRDGSWHRSDDSGLSSADERNPSRRQTPSPVPPPAPPQQSGHRPLSLLGQRDINNSFSSDNDSEREVHKVERYRSATTEREKQRRRLSRSGMPLPPLPDVPATVEELDEDAKSRKTTTPASQRYKKRSVASPSPPHQPPPALPLPPTALSPVFAPTAPLRTHTHVASRSKARQRKAESSASENEENLRRSFASSPAKRTRGSGVAGVARGGVRGMR